MAINVNITETDWKAKGLPLRTIPEKLKNAKTKVSEALRAYAGVAAGGMETLPAKATALKAIKTVLTTAKGTHKGNTKFLAHIAKMEAGLTAEVATINTALAGLTLDTMLGSANLYTFFHAYCTNVEHNPEPVEFLHVAGSMAKPALVATFVRPGAPKELNLYADIRDPLIANPNNAGALKAICDDVRHGLEGNELGRFKIKYKIVL